MNKDINCKNCGRYLGTAHGTVVAEILCPKSNCKMKNQIKVVATDRISDIRYIFKTPEIVPKKEKTNE